MHDRLSTLVANSRDMQKHLNFVCKYIRNLFIMQTCEHLQHQLLEQFQLLSNLCNEIYIYIYKNLYHKTKQIQFDHNTKHRTTQNSNQKINEKKNTNHHKTTTQGSESTNPIKKLQIKTINLVITHTTKFTNPIKKQKGKNFHLSYKNHHRSTGGKIKIRGHHQLLGQWVVESLNRRLRVQSIREMKR